MESAEFCAALAAIASGQIDAQIAEWRSGSAFPPELNGPIVDLLDRLSPQDVETVKWMMRLNASNAFFTLLNAFDGTGDLEAQPEGGFRLIFEHWAGPREGETTDLTKENGDFLHDQFMDAHMRSLEGEGLI